MRISRSGCLLLVLGMILFCSCMMPMLAFPFEFVFYLGLGWAFFGYRVGPETTLSATGFVTSMFWLAAITQLAHSSLSRLIVRAHGTGPRPWHWRWTVALVTGVMLMFMAAVGAVGFARQVGSLIGSREPWLRGSIESTCRMESQNNVKNIVLAAVQYGTSKEKLPPGATMGEYGILLHGWQTFLLPYIDQQDIFNSIDFKKPWDDPANQVFTRPIIRILINPEIAEDGRPGPAFTHYEANVRVIGGTRQLRFGEITDGASTTILVGEVAGNLQPWAKPGRWRDPAEGLNRDPSRGFAGGSPNGVNFGFADGSVRFIKSTIDPNVLKALSTPAGKEVIPVDWY